ncbi:alcohol dehydrogenase catalytic domain-containing protein [Actinomyces viscosus]|uniref:zinc-dependent alcohol dehydrogenase n=1 Tax=Actinomyces viscosus TaxID=1656 RepID=UPI0028E8FA6D|nr:alcohol dehydrogenase catalytic domain-containing protein [Actinomyces viscosus]
MRAAIYLGQHDVEVRDLPDPVCGPHDVVIENLRSSVCGTDAAVWSHGPGTGHKVDVGGEFGHEAVSRVVEVGSQVTGLRPGDRVFPYPRLVTGDPHRAGTMGAFSERILARDAELDRTLFSVPDDVDDTTACLIEPFTVGCRAARRSQPEPGESAIVYGCGTIGIAAGIALMYFGVTNVLMCDLSALRLSKAADLGFATCNPADASPYDVAASLYGTAQSLNGPTANTAVIVDAAGADSVLDDFMGQAPIGARFVSVAVGKALREVDLLQLSYAQQSIIGSGGYFPQDVKDVIAMMSSHRWDISSIITHSFPLEQITQALQTACDRDRALNVTITFDNEDARE